MRSIVIGLAALAGLATAMALYFFENAQSITGSGLNPADPQVMLVAVAIQTNMQMGAAAALAAVVLVAASCLVHAMVFVRPRVTPA